MSGVAKSAVHGGFPLGFAYGTLSNSTQASNVANSHTHPAGLTLLRKVYNGVAPPDGERVVGGGRDTKRSWSCKMAAPGGGWLEERGTAPDGGFK